MTAGNEGPVARRILSYLLSHPRAEDTLEGIVEWWLLEEQIKQHREHVIKVLDNLASQKLIIVRKSGDSRIRYRINKKNLKTIRMILKA